MATKSTPVEESSSSTSASEALTPMPPQVATPKTVVADERKPRVITGIGGGFETRPIKRTERMKVEG